MQKLLEEFLNAKIEYYVFKQHVYPKQYTDKEIYETEVEEPYYSIVLDNGEKKDVYINEIFEYLFKKLNNTK